MLYNINAPVDLDGGAGFDKVTVIGTELNDNFVITDEGVFGAGLNVRYANMEALDVDGLEGNDHFFIRSTKAGVITTIIGGHGNDTFDVSGDVTADIVSKDLEGRSGVLNHQVTATGDVVYDGLLAPGIDLNIADPASGQIIIEQSDDKTIVNEQGSTTDSYTIRLAQAPTAPVYVNVSAARTTQEEEDGSPVGDSMLISADSGVTWHRYLVLTITDTSAKTILVKAVDDGRAEGERVYAISHSAQSTDAIFNNPAIKNVRVTVLDNDKPEVVVRGTGATDILLEGTATTQITDTYLVSLGKAPVGNLDVVLTTDGQVTLSDTGGRVTLVGVNTYKITFTTLNWGTAVEVKATANA